MKRIECTLFDGLSDEEYFRLLQSMKPREGKFRRGAFVYRYDAEIKELSILCDGVASVVKIDADGNRILLERLTKGSIFGNSVSYGTRTDDDISVVADTECRTVTFVFDDLIKRCDGECGYRHKLLVNAITAMGNKIAAIGERTEITGNRATRDKLLCYFKFLCRKNGGGKTKLDMKLTDLADYICVDRSAMMRELRKLKDEGKVKIENKIVELNI
ncbi:putative uncharacterized protein [Acidiphilium sp. CAG:727]|nr:putative uncharacterized protein [Acidiphilium sp. CAG:727]